jgi:hypothetical protein
VTSQPGWHPDPLGRHDHRWFDGVRWTADVADDGVRRVDPYGTDTTRPTRRWRRPISALIAIIVALIATSIVVLWRSVASFARPAAHDVAIEECRADGAEVDVGVAITNLSMQQSSFTVFVTVTGPSLSRTIRSITIAVDDVAADSTTQRSASFPSTATSAECEVVAVGGPLPFGIDIGPLGVQE